MLFLLLPYTPMLFMGQEWAASTPFCFFTNHSGTFGEQVSEGRLKEFKNFGAEWPAAMLAAMPDPEKPDTFSRSRLNWAESDVSDHQKVLKLYRACLHLRKHDPVLRFRERTHWKTWTNQDILFIRYGSDDRPARLLVTKLADSMGDDTASAAPVKLETGWKIQMSSNERRFGGSDEQGLDDVLTLAGPQTLLLSRDL